MLLNEILPEGNTIDHAFDDENPDRFQQGNQLRSVHNADPERGGDQQQIST